MAHSKKMQPWVDNDMIKLSNGDRGFIKSLMGWPTDGIIDAAQKALQNSLGSLAFNLLLEGNAATSTLNQMSSSKSSTMKEITGWPSVQLVQNTLRCLCMIACTLIRQTCSKNRLPPSSIQKMKVSHWSSLKLACKRMVVTVECTQLLMPQHFA